MNKLMLSQDFEPSQCDLERMDRVKANFAEEVNSLEYTIRILEKALLIAARVICKSQLNLETHQLAQGVAHQYVAKAIRESAVQEVQNANRG